MRPGACFTLLCALSVGCGEGLRTAQPVDCDPQLDEGCPAGQHCRLIEGGARACLAPTTAPEGARCDPASCAPSEACLKAEGRLACHQVCVLATGEGCAAADACVYRVNEAGGEWGVCAEACTLSEGCDGACAPSEAYAQPVCIEAGPAREGERCLDTRCAAGLACLTFEAQPSCVRLCDEAHPELCQGARCIGPIPAVPSLRYCVP